jgi:RNA polymerase sigma-70 factor (ECF subfamily)
MSNVATLAVPLNGESTQPHSDEAELIAACRRGDSDAFGELVVRHQQRVFKLAGRFFRRREEVEDVAQETFLQAWRKLDTYRAKAPFEHWLTRVCLNCCYGRFRKRRGDDELPLEYDVPTTAGDPTARLEVERLLGQLPGEDRFLLLLLHGEGWSVAEIAGRLGWSKANVKVRAHRARKKLRGLLAESPV